MMKHLSVGASALILLVAACATSSEVTLLQAHNSACATLEAGVNAAVTRETSLSGEQWANVELASEVMKIECLGEEPADLRSSLERIRNAEGDLP